MLTKRFGMQILHDFKHFQQCHCLHHLWLTLMFINLNYEYLCVVVLLFFSCLFYFVRGLYHNRSVQYSFIVILEMFVFVFFLYDNFFLNNYCWKGCLVLIDIVMWLLSDYISFWVKNGLDVPIRSGYYVKFTVYIYMKTYVVYNFFLKDIEYYFQ